MKIDFLRGIKLILYAISFIEIFFFGYIADKTGDKTKMMLITAGLLLLNFIIYKILSARIKKNENIR